VIEIWQHGKLMVRVKTAAEAYSWVERVTGHSVGTAIARDGILIKRSDEIDMLMNPEDF
jgi:hypothetical protein